MFIALYMDTFNDTYINFMDTKENTITNGVFTKILYSDPLFTMNGLHFLFPVMFDETYSNNYSKNINCNNIETSCGPIGAVLKEYLHRHPSNGCQRRG